MNHQDIANAIAAHLAAELADQTAGIALVGSIATGTDHAHSDIDLIAATDRPRDTEIRSVDGRMATISWKRPEELRSAFDHPWEAGAAVPAWRTARILHDPQGLLASLQTAASKWTWEAIAVAADRWAAEGLVGLAEEVHKVVGMLTSGRTRAAAVNRSLIALQLPGLLGAADRILYASENELWDLVAEAEGPDWARDWDTAMRIEPIGLETSCLAALRLYRHAAARLETHCTADEWNVIRTACNLPEPA